jgi:hypothetical protein
MCNVVFSLAKIPEELRKVIVNAKKKDDLADCILQAVYYLQSNIPKIQKPKKSKKSKKLDRVGVVEHTNKRIRLE